MKQAGRIGVVIALLVGIPRGGVGPVAAQGAKHAAGGPTFTADAVMAHVKVLASDEFEGRAPGTKGEDLTVAYISEQFRKVGLKPGNPDGSYVQNVPMVGMTADPATSLVFRKGPATQTLAFKDDVVAWTKRVEERVSIDASEVVFVGYGVEAPEFQWDDYIGRPKGWGQQVSDAYIAQHYHKPSDQIRPDWDLSGALEDLQIYYALGARAASTTAWPQWKPGSEFKARRDRMMGK